MTESDDMIIEWSVDMATPCSLPLSAFYKRSFAYETTNKRWSTILKNIIENFNKSYKKIMGWYGQYVEYDVNDVIQGITILITDIEQNNKLQLLKSDQPDTIIWNSDIVNEQLKSSIYFYSTRWLLSECYIYRKLVEILENTYLLKEYDLFRDQKKESYVSGLLSIRGVGEYLLSLVEYPKIICEHELKSIFKKFVKLSLWGNKCDLSLSLGSVLTHETNPIELVEIFDSNLLVDDTDDIWIILKCPKLFYNTVILVCDNAGYEIFTDMCLADFLITYKLCKEVHFYLKAIPWYISDTTEFDFRWVVKQLMISRENTLTQIGRRWDNYLKLGIWSIKIDFFWTLSQSFNQMESTRPYLYNCLRLSKLIIFKGDANYRKLIGDINWLPETRFQTALQGFYPSNLCALRTIKADLICGLKPGVADRLHQTDPNWLLSGDYGIIQYNGDLNA